jgi:3-hydroxybutyryl-CoA dehydrogenase
MKHFNEFKNLNNKMNRVGIVGCGVMGSGIALVAGMAGYSIIVYDTNSASLEKAKKNLATTLSRRVEKGEMNLALADAIAKQIKFTNIFSDLAPCMLVLEAIAENLEAKQKVFQDLEKIVSPECILASNTSSLSITSLAAACKRPEYMIGIHFFNPALLMPLVEIVPGMRTQPGLELEIKELIESWAKTPVIAKDTPGFIVNRVARPFYGEALRIYEEGLADFKIIDAAMKEIGSFKMGPFELMDLIGNDINYAVTETVWKQFFFDPRYKPSLTQKSLVDSGYFGKKSGRGYYEYGSTNEQTAAGKKNTAASTPEQSQANEAVFIRILAMLINEAADAHYYGVATKEDIDLAMKKGMNYPKGPFKWADEIGIEKILSVLENLYATYSEDRYRPSILLRNRVKDKKFRFYSL